MGRGLERGSAVPGTSCFWFGQAELFGLFGRMVWLGERAEREGHHVL